MTTPRRPVASRAPGARRTLALATVALVGCFTMMAVATEDVTQHNGLSTSDPSHLRFFVEHRSPALVDLAKVVTDLGSVAILGPLAVLAMCILWWRGARLIVAVAPAASLALAATAASLTKAIVGRARPPAAVRLVTETQPSFPSGHATD